MVTMISQVQSEFELHARALLGLPVDTSLRQPGASSVIYGGVDARGVSFHQVAQALAEPGTDTRLFGTPASYLKRRMGVALAAASYIDAARSSATHRDGHECVGPVGTRWPPDHAKNNIQY